MLTSISAPDPTNTKATVNRFALIVHHTDAEREWAYDRKSSFGRLDRALDEAQAKGWTVVDMKTDWKSIFPFGNKERTARAPERMRNASRDAKRFIPET
jgi:hypothetical protein